MRLSVITTRITYQCPSCGDELERVQSYLEHAWQAHRKFMDGTPQPRTRSQFQMLN